MTIKPTSGASLAVRAFARETTLMSSLLMLPEWRYQLPCVRRVGNRVDGDRDLFSFGIPQTHDER